MSLNKGKQLLITGFEPFGGESINPSWEAVLRLPHRIGEYNLVKMRIPVVFSEAAEAVICEADRICPDVVLCVGQAGGREKITPELVAINLRHATVSDNMGRAPRDEKILPDGCAAYFSTLPVRKISEAISAAGIPSAVSYSAGTYVCNDVFYTLLSRFEGTATRVGFIHIPYSTEQNKEPSLSLDEIVKGLTVAIESIDS